MDACRLVVTGVTALCLFCSSDSVAMAQEPETPAVATGTFTVAEGAEHTESEEGKRWRDRGAAFWGWLEMDDPRVSGTLGLIVDIEEVGRTASGQGVGLMWGRGVLDTDAGSWTGPMSGVVTSDGILIPSWLVGAGAYEGLSLFLDLRGQRGDTVGIEGLAFVYEGDPPRIVATGMEDPQPTTVAQVNAGAVTGAVTIDGVALGQRGSDGDEFFFSDGTGVTILDTQGGDVPLLALINIVGQVASDEIDVSSWVPLEAPMADPDRRVEVFMEWVGQLEE